jgi:hypothetical protein
MLTRYRDRLTSPRKSPFTSAELGEDPATNAQFLGKLYAMGACDVDRNHGTKLDIRGVVMGITNQ